MSNPFGLESVHADLSYNSPLNHGPTPQENSMMVFKDSELQATLKEFMAQEDTYTTDLKNLTSYVNLQIDNQEVNYDLSDFEIKQASKYSNNLSKLLKIILMRHKELCFLVNNHRDISETSLIKNIYKWSFDVLPFYQQYIQLYKLSMSLTPDYNALIKRPLVKVRYINKFLLKLINLSSSLERSDLSDDLQIVQGKFDALLLSARKKDEKERIRMNLNNIGFNKVKSITDLTYISSYIRTENILELNQGFIKLSHPLLDQPFFYKIELNHVLNPVSKQRTLAIVKINETSKKTLLFPEFKKDEFEILKVSESERVVSLMNSMDNGIKIDLKIPDDFSHWLKIIDLLFGSQNKGGNEKELQLHPKLSGCGISVPTAKSTEPLSVLMPKSRSNLSINATAPLPLPSHEESKQVLISPADPVRYTATPSFTNKVDSSPAPSNENKTPKFNPHKFAQDYSNTLTLASSTSNSMPVASKKRQSLFNLFGFKKSSSKVDLLSDNKNKNNSGSNPNSAGTSTSSVFARSIKSSRSNDSIKSIAELPAEIKSIVNDNKLVVSQFVKLSKWAGNKWASITEPSSKKSIKLDIVETSQGGFFIMCYFNDDLEVNKDNLLYVIQISSNFEIRKSTSLDLHLSFVPKYFKSTLGSEDRLVTLLIRCLNPSSIDSLLKVVELIKSGSFTTDPTVLSNSESKKSFISNSTSNQSELSHMSSSTTMSSISLHDDIVSLGKPKTMTLNNNGSNSTLTLPKPTNKSIDNLMYSLDNSSKMSVISAMGSQISSPSSSMLDLRINGGSSGSSSPRLLNFPKPISSKNKSQASLNKSSTSINQPELLVFSGGKSTIKINKLDSESRTVLSQDTVKTLRLHKFLNFSKFFRIQLTSGSIELNQVIKASNFEILKHANNLIRFNNDDDPLSYYIFEFSDLKDIELINEILN